MSLEASCFGISYVVRMSPMAMFWLLSVAIKLNHVKAGTQCYSWWFIVAFPIVYFMFVFLLVAVLHTLCEVKAAKDQQ